MEMEDFMEKLSIILLSISVIINSFKITNLRIQVEELEEKVNNYCIMEVIENE